MAFSKDIGLGFRTYGRAFTFVFSKGLAWAFVFPAALNILLFFGGFSLFDALAGFIQDWVFGWLKLNSGDFFLAGLLKGFLSGLIWIVLKILFFFTFIYISGYILIILLSPLFAYLSAKTERIISGENYPTDAGRFVKDVLRGIALAMRNLIIQIGFIILLFIISFIPVIGWFSSVFLFLISSYFYGFSFMDYTSERHRFTISKSIKLIKKHRGLAVANGMVFSLSLFIPFCGTLLAGFAAVISVVAATLAMNEILKNEKLEVRS